MMRSRGTKGKKSVTAGRAHKLITVARYRCHIRVHHSGWLQFDCGGPAGVPRPSKKKI